MNYFINLILFFRAGLGLVSSQLLPPEASIQSLIKAKDVGAFNPATSNSDPLQVNQAQDVSAATTSSDAASTDSSATSFQAGDFQCIDDTKFKQFTSATSFVVNSCPPGFCVTRSPPKKNPCIGKEKALQIDGKLES